MQFTELQSAAQARSKGFCESIAATDSPCSVFLVEEVVNASGGRTGCFLYRGRMLTPALRSRTPDSCAWARAPLCAAAPEEAQQVVPQADGEGQPSWGELEGQALTLYLSYEEASPKMKRRVSSSAAPAAPWRASLRDASDDLLFCMRGLPTRVLLDAEARLALWGTSVAVAFPTTEDARAFVQGLCQVEVAELCLAGTPQASLLDGQVAEQRLRGAAPAAPAAAASPTSQAIFPPSPDPLAAAPRVGCKRPAPTLLPAALVSPAVKPRYASRTPLITPALAAELLI